MSCNKLAIRPYRIKVMQL